MGYQEASTMAEKSSELTPARIGVKNTAPPSDGDLVLEREFPSGAALVTAQVVRIVEYLVSRKLVADADQNKVAVCLEEGLRNAVVHGNQEDFAKPTRYRVFVFEDRWRVEIEDRGFGFDPHGVPSPVESDRLWAQSGRGLSIISLYADAVCYYSDGRVLQMDFRR